MASATRIVAARARPGALALTAIDSAPRDPGADRGRDQQQQRALGGGVADVDPALPQVVALSSDAIHCPAIRITSHAGAPRAAATGSRPAERGRARAAGAGQRGHHEHERAHQHHRAEDVQEQRQVPVVRPDGGERAHAPGFQIISTSRPITPTVRSQCMSVAPPAPPSEGVNSSWRAARPRWPAPRARSPRGSSRPRPRSRPRPARARCRGRACRAHPRPRARSPRRWPAAGVGAERDRAVGDHRDHQRERGEHVEEKQGVVHGPANLTASRGGRCSPAAPPGRLEARVGHRRGVHPDHLHALGRGQAGHGAQHRHAMVPARVDRPAAQRGAVAADDEAVLGGLDVGAEPAQPSTTPAIRSDSLRRSSPRRAPPSPRRRGRRAAPRASARRSRAAPRPAPRRSPRAAPRPRRARPPARVRLHARLLEIADDHRPHPLGDPQEARCASS